MKLPIAEKFCADNGFSLELKGEIGFGRPCVGIMNPKTECYVAWQYYKDEEKYEGERTHTVAGETAPPNAYHKGQFLAVLLHGNDGEIPVDEAAERLEEWIGRIVKAGYAIETYYETHGITNLLMHRSRVAQKAVVDPVPSKTKRGDQAK